MALVAQYDNISLTDSLPIPDLSSSKQNPPEPDLVVTDPERDENWPPIKYVWPSVGENRKAVEILKQALSVTSNLDPEECYQLYRAIDAPRVPYLTANMRHRLLHRLGVLERKDEHAMLRYMSVIDDMKATEISLSPSEWNTAISFATSYVTKTSVAEVEGALRLWKEMEQVARVRSTSATFNILFDVATKAGKFNLAEMIHHEMENRGLPFDRYTHVGLIHHHGLRADGEGVRKAYKDLVESSEIVDTVVLNCIISSLIRAYEPQAALQVYEAMKKLIEKKSGFSIPPQNYWQSRKVNKTIMKFALRAKHNPEELKILQERVNISPDIHTYEILVQHVAVTAGELQKTSQLLDEMRFYNVPIHGSIFRSLFQAFAIHGKRRYSHWTEARLESVWKAYVKASAVQTDHIYVGKWIVYWALSAFRTCAGRERAMQVWDECKERWSGNESDVAFVTTPLMEEE
jgi:pentatricopeptide repeat protein